MTTYIIALGSLGLIALLCEVFAGVHFLDNLFGSMALLGFGAVLWSAWMLSGAFWPTLGYGLVAIIVNEIFATVGKGIKSLIDRRESETMEYEGLHAV